MTAKELDKYLGQTITVTGRHVMYNKKYGRFCVSGKLICYGYKKYGVEHPDEFGRYKLDTFSITGIDSIEFGGSL